MSGMNNWWHKRLDLPRHDKAWFVAEMTGELAEYRDAKGLIYKWSELSDVVYLVTRAVFEGRGGITADVSRLRYAVGLLYMYPKYTSRFLFFYRAGKKLGVTTVREVRNPQKTHKLHDIAGWHDLDPVAFQKVCEKQLRYWPLLP